MTDDASRRSTQHPDESDPELTVRQNEPSAEPQGDDAENNPAKGFSRKPAHAEHDEAEEEDEGHERKAS
jgi:hypothetical protein